MELQKIVNRKPKSKGTVLIAFRKTIYQLAQDAKKNIIVLKIAKRMIEVSINSNVNKLKLKSIIKNPLIVSKKRLILINVKYALSKVIYLFVQDVRKLITAPNNAKLNTELFIKMNALKLNNSSHKIPLQIRVNKNQVPKHKRVQFKITKESVLSVRNKEIDLLLAMDAHKFSIVAENAKFKIGNNINHIVGVLRVLIAKFVTSNIQQKMLLFLMLVDIDFAFKVYTHTQNKKSIRPRLQLINQLALSKVVLSLCILIKSIKFQKMTSYHQKNIRDFRFLKFYQKRRSIQYNAQNVKFRENKKELQEIHFVQAVNINFVAIACQILIILSLAILQMNQANSEFQYIEQKYQKKLENERLVRDAKSWYKGMKVVII